MALTGELLIQQATVQADYAHTGNIRSLTITPRNVILHFIAQIMQTDRFSIHPQSEVTPEVSSKQAIYLSTVSRFDQVNLPVCAALQCYFQIIVKNAAAHLHPFCLLIVVNRRDTHIKRMNKQQ